MYSNKTDWFNKINYFYSRTVLTAEPENKKSAEMTKTQLERLGEYGGGGGQNFTGPIKETRFFSKNCS